jgi:hypothetical protein
MTTLALIPILAAQGELIRIVILAVVMLGGAILKKITDAREQAERERARLAKQSQASKTQAGPPRRDAEIRSPDAVWPAGQEAKARPRPDNPHRNEIEQFLEEVGRRRPPANPQERSDLSRGAPSSSAPPRPIARPPQAMPVPVQRIPPAASRMRPETAKAPAQPAIATPPLRPGAEMALRKGPGSEDLGTQVRAHLSQYLDSTRMSQRVKADLGSAVERAVREHLGKTETRGTEEKEAPALAGVPIMTLLRNPEGVRTAILVNEILERPKCLRRKT